jgi:NTE family protein
LTDNALIFEKKKMKEWWQQGFEYAKNKSELMSDYIQDL